MSDEQITSQVATESAPPAETGTAGPQAPATDVSSQPSETPAATPPADGTAEQTATASTAEGQTETSEQKTRRDRQREARRQPPPPQPSPAEIIAAHEAQKERDRQATERVQQEFRRRATYLGEVPADPNNPTGPTVYQQLLAEANTAIPDGDDAYYTEETRALVRKVNAARARLQEYDGRRGLIAAEAEPIRQAMRTEALDWIGNQFERGLSEAGLDVQAVLAAGAAVPPDQRMPTIVKALATQIEAKHAPRVAELEDDLAAALAEVDTWKRRAGGEAAQIDRGGVPVNGAGTLTLKKLMAMPDFAERAERGEFAGLDLTK